MYIIVSFLLPLYTAVFVCRLCPNLVWSRSMVWPGSPLGSPRVSCLSSPDQMCSKAPHLTSTLCLERQRLVFLKLVLFKLWYMYWFASQPLQSSPLRSRTYLSRLTRQLQRNSRCLWPLLPWPHLSLPASPSKRRAKKRKKRYFLSNFLEVFTLSTLYTILFSC